MNQGISCAMNTREWFGVECKEKYLVSVHSANVMSIRYGIV